MSKHQVKTTLKREIKRVNQEIDERIIKGMPYSQQARHHKILLARLGLLNRSTLLARTMRVATMFMF
jgi:hypothetical protein